MMSCIYLDVIHESFTAKMDNEYTVSWEKVYNNY